MNKFEYELITNRYPFLKVYNRWTGKEADFERSEYFTEAFSMPEGWATSFGYEFFEELREELIKYNFLDEYRIADIKEKYGILRFYDFGHPKDSKISEIISKYRELSKKTCMTCGTQNNVNMTEGWVEVICDTCLNKRNKAYKEKQY